MVTTTRRPALSWAAVGGAVRYQVWINISRTDYDFAAAGNLIDLYTKVAEPTGTSYTPTWDLPDRWTYKWYVVAVNGSGATTTSNIRRFSVYLPDAGDGRRRRRHRQRRAGTSTATARSSRTRTGGSRSRPASTTCSGG